MKIILIMKNDVLDEYQIACDHIYSHQLNDSIAANLLSCQ